MALAKVSEAVGTRAAEAMPLALAAALATATRKRSTGNDGGRVAKGYRRHRPGPMVVAGLVKGAEVDHPGLKAGGESW